MELNELIQSVNILDYISQFVDLEEKGGEYWGLSPLKEEKTPSFSIRPETGQWWDFSSGKGGDLLNFICYYNHCSVGRGIEILKQYSGYSGELSERQQSAFISVVKKYSRKSRAHKESKASPLAPDYMDRYDDQPDKYKVWIEEGISPEVLHKFGVKYDSFSNRLVYPIYDLGGMLVNVGGRTLDPQYKAKGLRKYTYVRGWEGGMGVVYGLLEGMESILAKKEVILFEGAKSVMKAHTWGLENVGAILTSHLNEQQMKILVRLGCTVVFALDSDVDITEDSNIKRLSRYVRVEYIKDMEGLLEEKDAPVDRGKEVFKRLYGRRFMYKV